MFVIYLQKFNVEITFKYLQEHAGLRHEKLKKMVYGTKAKKLTPWPNTPIMCGSTKKETSRFGYFRL
ncbi:hypothetical protein Hanom_Chr00s000003g01602841 [Helianthus anomalus]